MHFLPYFSFLTLLTTITINCLSQAALIKGSDIVCYQCKSTDKNSGCAQGKAYGLEDEPINSCKTDENCIAYSKVDSKGKYEFVRGCSNQNLCKQSPGSGYKYEVCISNEGITPDGRNDIDIIPLTAE